MSRDSAARPLILAADDDADVLELVAFRLRRAGCEVITVGDGKAALEAGREHSPDLAVLDVTMPGMSGIEVTRALREDDAARPMPIVLLSASVDEAEIKRGLEAGADKYVGKPFSARELIDVVEGLLRARERPGSDRVQSDAGR
jgi:DNA-binding response OmpR family regulator